MRTESARAELEMNRSELIRMAVEQFLERLDRAKVERELVERYTANAIQAGQTCEGFAYVDSEGA
jgi:hypothetical protein